MNTQNIQITEKYFRDWENATFGYGYGSGEEHILTALKSFFSLLENNRSYDHRVLEKELGPQVTWFLINTLCHEDIIEYGTSPRSGFLSEKGRLLRDFLSTRTVDELYQIIFDGNDDHCSRDYCSCNGEQVNKKCENPLF